MSLPNITNSTFQLNCNPFQAHCGVWSHHLWVSVPFPQGLPSRGQGGCRCRGCLPSQVFAFCMHFCAKIFVVKNQSWSRSRVWGVAKKAAHNGQILSRLSNELTWSWESQGNWVTNLQDVGFAFKSSKMQVASRSLF